MMDRMEGRNSQESLETLRKMEDYLSQGYLLHGSKRRLEMIEPRKADDTDPERVAGKANAVYASDEVYAPILRALFDRKDPTRDSRSSYSGNAIHMKVTGENATFTNGYVYVLPRDSFILEGEGDDQELISYSPVTPIETIVVTPEILEHLQNLEIDLH